MVSTALSSGIDKVGVSIEFDSEKEVSGESIVVLSWKGHYGGTQAHTHTLYPSPPLSLSPSLPLSLSPSLPLYLSFVIEHT